MTDHQGHALPGSELELVVCPECAAPAEVLDRFVLPSTDGPVEHAKVQCVRRHGFLLPADRLPAVGAPVAPRTAGR